MKGYFMSNLINLNSRFISIFEKLTSQVGKNKQGSGWMNYCLKKM